MRLYPNADISIYWEYIPWNLYCHSPEKTWKRKSSMEAKHAIAHWRDLEGARLTTVTKKLLNFKNWPISRVRSEACLPLYYGVGQRFIRLEKTAPADFKCTEQPLCLQEAREVKRLQKQVAREQRRLRKEQKKIEKSQMKKKRIRK